MELELLASDFANAMMRADARRPQASSQRSGCIYQPGIGPHSEDAAVGKRYEVEEIRPYVLSPQDLDLAR
jgi:hypothetical protein